MNNNVWEWVGGWCDNNDYRKSLKYSPKSRGKGADMVVESEIFGTINFGPSRVIRDGSWSSLPYTVSWKLSICTPVIGSVVLKVLHFSE